MRKLLALLLLLGWMPLQAQSVAVSGVRLWTAPDHTRLVFDAAAAVDHKVFSLEDPKRLVIDLQAVKFQAGPPVPKAEDPLIRRIRSAERNGGRDLRVVLDLKQAVRPKSFLLKPNREYGHRLVVDLYPSVQAAGKATQSVTKSIDQARSRDVVIAIDAGHGGEDPGARGPKGTFEKNAVLAIARKLEALVEREPGMRPVMIRDGDYTPGDRLPSERKLAEQLQVGRTSVREAIRQLETIGLLEARHGLGTFVKDPSNEMIQAEPMHASNPARVPSRVFLKMRTRPNDNPTMAATVSPSARNVIAAMKTPRPCSGLVPNAPPAYTAMQTSEASIR